MNSILVFAGSISKNSINKKLAVYASTLLSNSAVNINVLDLNDYALPLFSVDLENEKGIPDAAHQLLKTITTSNGIILSLAEHNGAYTAAFKNCFDWMSRIDGKLWNDIPMLLMAASPGGRGGQSVLDIAKNRFPFMGGNVVADFSLPFFQDNYSEDRITDEKLNTELSKAVTTFENKL